MKNGQNWSHSPRPGDQSMAMREMRVVLFDGKVVKEHFEGVCFSINECVL